MYTYTCTVYTYAPHSILGKQQPAPTTMKLHWYPTITIPINMVLGMLQFFDHVWFLYLLGCDSELQHTLYVGVVVLWVVYELYVLKCMYMYMYVWSSYRGWCQVH